MSHGRAAFQSLVCTRSDPPQVRLHQVEYALEAVKHGSAAVGLHSKMHAILLAFKVRHLRQSPCSFAQTPPPPLPCSSSAREASWSRTSKRCSASMTTSTSRLQA